MDSDSITNKVDAWTKNKTTSFAADLVAAAFVLGKYKEAINAAEFLLADKSLASESAKEIAKRILYPGVEQDQGYPTRLSLPHTDQIHEQIRALRARTREEPRNAIVWADLAREYALVGQKDQAIRAMDIAVALGPTNRFILRSAARLYIHEGKVDKAHYILRKAAATKFDPWLLSAEIAVASAANRTSNWVTNGQRMLSDESLSPFQKNELSGAVGMMELSHGKVKSARNLFRQALIEPTENTVAQVEWAHRKKHMSGLDLDLEVARPQTPYPFEAAAWELFSDSAWRKSLDQSLEWLRDQPFSTRPIMLASYLSLSVLEDYRYGEQILKIGLRANPTDATLLNNMAYLCASSGRIADAEGYFNSIQAENIRELPQGIAIIATAGLIAFRRGSADEGRALYRQAMNMAKAQEHKKQRAIAAIYLAREEILIKSSEAEKAFELANKESRSLNEPDVNVILNNVLVDNSGLQSQTDSANSDDIR
ncbi:MAG: tetratricopeptide repeat protein [Pyrinomonadaceae bacterium]